MSNQVNDRYDEARKYEERRPFLQIPVFVCPPEEYFREEEEPEEEERVIIIDL